jgi:hypothetical protein
VRDKLNKTKLPVKEMELVFNILEFGGKEWWCGGEVSFSK